MFLRRPMAKGHVRPALVAVPPPGLDHVPCFGHGFEPVQVQALVSQGTVERLDEGVFGRLARPREVDANLAPVSSQIDQAASELRSVISKQIARRPTLGHETVLVHRPDVGEISPAAF